MQSSSIMNMKNIDLNTVDRDELVDIRDVKVTRHFPNGNVPLILSARLEIPTVISMANMS